MTSDRLGTVLSTASTVSNITVQVPPFLALTFSLL